MGLICTVHSAHGRDQRLRRCLTRRVLTTEQVGLHNQRHFILFMVWLSIGCWTVAVLGYDHFWLSFDSRAAVRTSFALQS